MCMCTNKYVHPTDTSAMLFTCPAHQLPAREKQGSALGKLRVKERESGGISGGDRQLEWAQSLWKWRISGSRKHCCFRIRFYSECLSTQWRRVTPHKSTVRAAGAKIISLSDPQHWDMWTSSTSAPWLWKKFIFIPDLMIGNRESGRW